MSTVFCVQEKKDRLAGVRVLSLNSLYEVFHICDNVLGLISGVLNPKSRRGFAHMGLWTHFLDLCCLFYYLKMKTVFPQTSMLLRIIHENSSPPPDFNAISRHTWKQYPPPSLQCFYEAYMKTVPPPPRLQCSQEACSLGQRAQHNVKHPFSTHESSF